ncbi:RNA polymerase sporulation sigma factor SigK [Proteinivorax hydrogeniformans]|uniref:RNA polymerase sporulation sigma factor SigK n=1 Tax=Proteinivorax hydrogeniformans TaxID=1826727 RepID=A0AAU8HR01_9FIRM
MSILFALAYALKELSLLVSYVKNNTFPQPLSAKEEEHYLIKMEQGDKEARKKLIEHNLRLVAHIVKKYDNTAIEHDDLISLGSCGLMKAIDSFDRKKGIKLATYAARCIENEILMQLRSNKKSRDDKSLEEPLGTDGEGNELTLMDILGTESDLFEKVDTKLNIARLNEVLFNLTQKERFVIVKRFGLGSNEILTQREIAEKLGISRSYVSRIEKKAIIKLLKELKVQNLI